MACSIHILSMIYRLGQHWAMEKLRTEGCFWKVASLWLGALGNWGSLGTTCCTAVAAGAWAPQHPANNKAECICFFHAQAKHF